MNKLLLSRRAVRFWLLTFVYCAGFAHSLRAQRPVAPAAYHALYASPAAVAARTPRLVRYDLRVSATPPGPLAACATTPWPPMAPFRPPRSPSPKATRP